MTPVRPIADDELVRALRPLGSRQLPSDVLDAARTAALTTHVGSRWRPVWMMVHPVSRTRELVRARPLRSGSPLFAAIVLLASAGGVLALSGVLGGAPMWQVGAPASYAPSPSAGSRATGSLGTPRTAHTASVLNDGRVLIVGGSPEGETTLATAEIYDPGTGEFTPTGSMTTGRYFQSAVTLEDGRVLVVAGISVHKGNGLATAEVFDPATGAFSPTGAMPTGVEGQTATLLSDGRVLVLGASTTEPTDVSEVWDPTSGTFAAGPLADAGYGSIATRLPDGRVLVTDSVEEPQLTTACLWDPATGCQPAGTMGVSRLRPSATLLSDGRVLVVGGQTMVAGDWITLPTAEIWDPSSLSFSPAGTMAEGRQYHTATPLPGGRVLILGGIDGRTDSSAPLWGALDTAEIWDPETLAFSSGAPLTTPRWLHTSTLLDDGSVLVVGGQTSGLYVGEGVLASAEVWQP